MVAQALLRKRQDIANSLLEGLAQRIDDVLDASTPDGTYPYDPPGEGFFFRNIGAVLGTCASTFEPKGGHRLLDCDRVRAAVRPGDM